MTPAEPEASVRKLPATDACAVMPNFLGPFSLKYMLLIVLFAEQPGMIGRAHRTRELYGQVTEVHLAFESKPVFTDNLLD